MATYRGLIQNRDFLQYMEKRARALARLADPLADVPASTRKAWLTPAWEPYMNPLLMEIERMRKVTEAFKPPFPGWTATEGRAATRLDQVLSEIDVPELDLESEDDTPRIEISGDLAGRSPEELGQVLAEVTMRMFLLLTGALDPPDGGGNKEWVLRTCNQAFEAGLVAQALWASLTNDTEEEPDS